MGLILLKKLYINKNNLNEIIHLQN